MPRTVRIGILLIAVALVLDVAAIFMAKGWTGATQAAIVVILFGGLLLGIAHRRNWARILFTVLFALALPFSMIAMSRFPLSLELVGSIWRGLLQAVGLVLLFLPEASAWYASRDRAA